MAIDTHLDNKVMIEAAKNGCNVKNTGGIMTINCGDNNERTTKE